jgi:signal transduction histidine kinase
MHIGHEGTIAAMASARRVNWRVVGVASVVAIVLFAVQQSVGTRVRRDLSLATALGLQTVTWGVWLLLLPLIIRAANLHPLRGRPAPSWIARTVVEGVLFVVAHSVIAGVIRWVTGLAVATTLSAAIANSVTATFASNVLRYAAILSVWQAVVYHDTVRARDRRAAALELDLARARLANVEACLRPHFLFNTLNAISALVREDPRAAERAIGDLSELLRAALTADPGREIRFEDELTFTTRYLDLERVRFHDRLRVVVDVSDEARGALVPQLLLQPLVENALRHGLAPLEAGGSIVVAAARREAMLHVSVRDDGVGLAASPRTRGAGTGLRALRTRLAHFYGDRHRFVCGPASPRGTLVEIDIPYRSAAA